MVPVNYNCTNCRGHNRTGLQNDRLADELESLPLSTASRPPDKKLNVGALMIRI